MVHFKNLVTSIVLLMPLITKVDGRKCYQCTWTKDHDGCNGFTSATPTVTCENEDCVTIYGKVNGQKASIHQCADMDVKWFEEQSSGQSVCSTFGQGCTKLPDQNMPDGSKVTDMQVCCCNSDLCNSGAGFIQISMIFIISVTFLSILA